MRAQGGGKIILLTTDAAREPTPGESMVGAAGAVVMFLTRSLAKEPAVSGIRVNAVATTITTGAPPYERNLEARRTDPGNVLARGVRSSAGPVEEGSGLGAISLRPAACATPRIPAPATRSARHCRRAEMRTRFR